MHDQGLIERLEAVAAETIAALRSIASARDWLDEALDPHGDGLKTDEAAFIMACSTDTARRRGENAAAAGKPIGILIAGAVWLFSERRVLEWIEADGGVPERLAAETRAQKSRGLRSLPQKSA